MLSSRAGPISMDEKSLTVGWEHLGASAKLIMFTSGRREHGAPPTSLVTWSHDQAVSQSVSQRVTMLQGTLKKMVLLCSSQISCGF